MLLLVYLKDQFSALFFSSITKLSLSSSLSLTLYADDILLHHPVFSSHCLRKVQLDLQAISLWLSSRFLKINASKTKYMIVTRKSQSFISSLPSLHFNNQPNELVLSYKYLCIILASNLSRSCHMQATCSKARRLIGMIYCKCYTNFTPSSAKAVCCSDPSSPSILFICLGPFSFLLKC